MTEREQFEAAMRVVHPEWAFTSDPVFDYHNERTRCAWEGWQEARASIPPAAAPSDELSRLALLGFAEEVKQLCDDYSSRSGNVYIMDVNAAIDSMLARHVASIPQAVRSLSDEDGCAYPGCKCDGPAADGGCANPARYTDAIGKAGQDYHRQFQHAHPLPALWRWQELWDRMYAASCAPQPSPAGVKEDGKHGGGAIAPDGDRQ